MKKILFVTFAAIGLSFLASSCVKEKGFEERVNEIVAAQLDSLNQQVAALEKTQAALNDSLKNVKGDIEKLSKQSKSLTDSIAAVKDSLAAQKEWTEAELKTISGKVTAIEKAQKTFMEDVYERLGLLWNRIQKIDVIPDYNDGSVKLDNKDTVIRFIVRPDSVGRKLAEKHPTGDSTFYLLAKKVSTKSSVTLDTLKIKSVSYSTEGFLSVVVDPKKLDPQYFKEEQPYSGCLVVNDGNSETTSGFFPLTPVIETANCYIVSAAGTYKLKAVKGNSNESVGDVKSVEVLWESFGTSNAPTAKDIISAVSYSNGKITYTVTNKKGNAVIAAKDASNKILWSWHIWCTDQPEGQAYENNAGTMMDRNLGATSTNKGQVSALGLMYQWGRKDPFLGSDKIYYVDNPNQAASTLASWPTVAGPKTPDESVTIPTTFITKSSANGDWTTQNDYLWKTSSGKKTIYDPCPAGWRVPDGGGNGVWRTAFGTDNPSSDGWDGTNHGLDFAKGKDKLLSEGICWYPVIGYRYHDDGKLADVGNDCYWWSCTATNTSAFTLSYQVKSGTTEPSSSNVRAHGFSVRCVQE